MIEEIGRLGRETFVVLRICRYHHFHRFLAHLLRGLSDALGQQFGRIGPFGLVRGALGNGFGQPAQQMPTRILFDNNPAVPLPTRPEGTRPRTWRSFRVPG